MSRTSGKYRTISKFRFFRTAYYGCLHLFSSTFGLIFIVRDLLWARHPRWLMIGVMAAIMTITLTMLNVLLRFIVIDGAKGCVTYYSLFRPFGKRFFFNNFTHVYTTTDSVRFGYECIGIHLIDNNHIRRVMSCIFYRNKSELREAIPLPESKKWLTLPQHIALQMTGRFKVPRRWKSTVRKKRRNK